VWSEVWERGCPPTSLRYACFTATCE
jgi:hypothetical protein